MAGLFYIPEFFLPVGTTRIFKDIYSKTIIRCLTG